MHVFDANNQRFYHPKHALGPKKPMLPAMMHVLLSEKPWSARQKHGADRLLHVHRPRAPALFPSCGAPDGVCSVIALQRLHR